MKKPFINAQFYETYYFANCVRNILHDQFAYIRHLNDFYGDDAYLNYAAPFPRFSAFHGFLEFIIGAILTDDTENCALDIRQDQISRFKSQPAALADMKPDVLPIEHALTYHDIPHTSFVNWLSTNGKTFDDARDDDVDEYLDVLREESAIETLLEQAVRETFYILYGNRELLMLFNQMMSDQMSQAVLSDIDTDISRHFDHDGVLRRVATPEWVKRVVFYRDRGMCCNCGRDLSGTLNIWPDEHYDHIVPLVNGGLNDVTNIQLLCGDCNRRKSDGDATTSSRYEDWYDMDS